jgi:hypothetical protein
MMPVIETLGLSAAATTLTLAALLGPMMLNWPVPVA